MSQSKQNLLTGALFVLVVTAASHLLFSWMGFTPTDEGTTLAVTRRILDGQVPHRDFISIRPFVSPLIHLPALIFGGAYVFWLSRLFVWFELTTLSWLWVSIISRLAKTPFSRWQQVAVALIAFAATTHTKHITAWNTIDGLFCLTVGFALCIREQRVTKIIGYFLIGLAVLCKQSFIFVAPCSLLLLKDWRDIRYWLALVSSGVGYLTYLLVTGAFFDAFLQLNAHRELLTVGFLAFVSKRMAVSLLLGYIAGRLCLRDQPLKNRNRELFAFCSLYAGPLLASAVALYLGIMIGAAYGLFGFLAGFTIHLFLGSSPVNSCRRASILVLVTAWSVGLSLGYNSPALMAGPMLAALITLILTLYPDNRLTKISLPVAALLIVVAFGVGRARHVYRDQPAVNLTKPIGSVFAGGRFIYTNPNTFAFMSDLNRAVNIARAQGKQYAIIPDAPGYWATAPEQNPLPAIWTLNWDLGTGAMMNRTLRAIDASRNDTVFIVQKVEAKDLAEGFLPLVEKDYEVVSYVRANFVKASETDYFELYVAR